MWKITCGLVAVVLVTAVMATEQSADNNNNDNHDRWLSSLSNPRPSRSVHTPRDWFAQAWQPEESLAASSRHQRWSAEDEERDSIPWEAQQEPLGTALHFSNQGTLEDDLDNSEEAVLELIRQQENNPWLAKRQPPRRLGSLVDLYKDVAHGLSPFVATPENQPLPAKPERRSGRRPAACRFAPFNLVCWNAARRGAVMRQRSAQYAQASSPF